MDVTTSTFLNLKGFSSISAQWKIFLNLGCLKLSQQASCISFQFLPPSAVEHPHSRALLGVCFVNSAWSGFKEHQHTSYSTPPAHSLMEGVTDRWTHLPQGGGQPSLFKTLYQPFIKTVCRYSQLERAFGSCMNSHNWHWWWWQFCVIVSCIKCIFWENSETFYSFCRNLIQPTAIPAYNWSQSRLCSHLSILCILRYLHQSASKPLTDEVCPSSNGNIRSWCCADDVLNPKKHPNIVSDKASVPLCGIHGSALSWGQVRTWSSATFLRLFLSSSRE